MLTNSSAASLTLALAFGVGACADAHQTQNLPDIVDSVIPAVARISCVGKKPQTLPMPPVPVPTPLPKKSDKNPDKPDLGTGTGVVIDKANGYIITNNHVAGDCTSIKVILHDDKWKEIPATLVGADSLTDVAVIKIPAPRGLSQATLGNSDHLRLGDDVFAIGHPFGLNETVTRGIVSGRNRVSGNPFDKLIQTDTAINPGNSGGPLYNTNGEVVGINNSIFTITGQFGGIGFAIPINQAKLVADKLIAHGEVPWGFMGASLGVMNDENMQKAGRPDLRGVWIEAVTSGMPADVAGLKSGDVALRVNGTEVNQTQDFARTVGETLAGNVARIDIWRGGEVITKEVLLGKRPKNNDLVPTIILIPQ